MKLTPYFQSGPQKTKKHCSKTIEKIVLKVLVRQQGKSLKIVSSLTFSSFLAFYILCIK